MPPIRVEPRPCRLPETFPTCERRDLTYDPGTRVLPYDEKLAVGYRYYDRHPEEIAYPFGHGLSYTAFAYRDLRVEKVEGHNVTVALEVENTGKFVGDEVVQLYVQDVESSIVTPDKELKAFKRITLAPGEVQTVRLELNERSFRLMDRRFNWVIEEGVFRLMAGASSEDIRCEVDIALEGETL